jgi:hypothetical protein
MEAGFTSVRQELLASSNPEGLMELKDLWLKKMSDLERTLEGGVCTEAVLDKQMRKIEAMLNAKLLDLDLSVSSMSPQFKEIQQQMQEVLTATRQGEANADQRMGAMLTELKSLQTQLTEVIELQALSSQNLSQVRLTTRTPSLFCFSFSLSLCRSISVSLSALLSPLLSDTSTCSSPCVGTCYAQELHRQCEQSHLPHDLCLDSISKT